MYLFNELRNACKWCGFYELAYNLVSKVSDVFITKGVDNNILIFYIGLGIYIVCVVVIGGITRSFFKEEFDFLS